MFTGCLPDVYDLRNIALAFRAALKADNAGLLSDWIHKAKRCEFGAVVRFAYGLQKDISGRKCCGRDELEHRSG